MVDYSKWDALEVSSDDEKRPRHPKVTKLDKPQTVTIKNNQIIIHEDSDNNVEEPAVNENFENDKREVIPSSCYSIFNPVEIKRNGGYSNTHIWSQSRNNVTIYFPLQDCVKGPNLSFILIDSAKPDVQFRETAAKLKVIDTKSNTVLIEKTFCHAVLADEDTWFWEIRTYKKVINAEQIPFSIKPENVRFLYVTFTKSAPIQDCTLWWKSFFVDDPEIDVLNLEDRHDEKNRDDFMKAWQTAQSDFKNKNF